MKNINGLTSWDGPALVADVSEWSTIVNALRFAASQYAIGGDGRTVRERLECMKLADETSALADKIAEEAGV